MSYLKNHKVIVSFLGGVIILAAIIVPRVFLNKQVVEVQKEYSPLVSVIKVDDYAGNIKEIDTDAIIESKDQVEMKAQISAPVQEINVGIGDSVYAGQTLLILKNDDIESQVAQAVANLASAESRLSNTGRDVDNAARDAYAKIEDAVRNKTDFLFINPGTVNPDITVRTENRNIQVDINTKRIIIGEKLRDWKISAPAGVAITKEKETKISEAITFAKLYFDTLANIVNDITVNNSGISQEVIDGYRSAVNGAQTQVNNASMSYAAYLSAWRVNSSTSTGQLTSAEAAVSQAKAALQGAQSLYNKSIIKSPINGTVSVLPFRLGDLVTPGSIVASIVNKNGLELKAYISSADAAYVKEGNKVMIDDLYSGVVSRVSPSIDTRTKKVEIKITVNDRNTSLIVGDTSNVKIFSNGSEISAGSTYTLPISAVNINSSGAFVYLFDASSTDSAIQKVSVIEVKTGEVSGEYIRINSGIEKGMSIVTPVIGLKNGSSIKVKK